MSEQASENVVRGRETAEAIVARLEYEYGGRKVSDGAVLDRDPVVAGGVVDAVIAGIELVAAEHAVTVDRVPVQIERDVVRPDHDPVARAVGQVAVELRIAADRGTAADVACACLIGAEGQESRDDQCKDHRPRQREREKERESWSSGDGARRSSTFARIRSNAVEPGAFALANTVGRWFARRRWSSGYLARWRSGKTGDRCRSAGPSSARYWASSCCAPTRSCPGTS